MRLSVFLGALAALFALGGLGVEAKAELTEQQVQQLKMAMQAAGLQAEATMDAYYDYLDAVIEAMQQVPDEHELYQDAQRMIGEVQRVKSFLSNIGATDSPEATLNALLEFKKALDNGELPHFAGHNDDEFASFLTQMRRWVNGEFSEPQNEEQLNEVLATIDALSVQMVEDLESVQMAAAAVRQSYSADAIGTAIKFLVCPWLGYRSSYFGYRAVKATYLITIVHFGWKVLAAATMGFAGLIGVLACVLCLFLL